MFYSYVMNILIFQVRCHTFHDISIPKVIFHDFPDLENFYFKFHDFPDEPCISDALSITSNTLVQISKLGPWLAC